MVDLILPCATLFFNEPDLVNDSCLHTFAESNDC